MPLNESTVEEAALTWFGELGYAIGHGPQLAPDESAAKRDSFGEVMLVGRLREAIWRLNPAKNPAILAGFRSCVESQPGIPTTIPTKCRDSEGTGPGHLSGHFVRIDRSRI